MLTISAGSPNLCNAAHITSGFTLSKAFAQSSMRSSVAPELLLCAASIMRLTNIRASAAPRPGRKPYCEFRIRRSAPPPINLWCNMEARTLYPTGNSEIGR
eukprot:6640243-Pyramimonas_sp.AAC.1